jgi:hypothetical protein
MNRPIVRNRDQDPMSDEPWQLAMFRKGLKKRLRLKALEKLLKPVAPGERCLLLTCGDNNGAMNYFLRKLGGQVVVGRSRGSLDCRDVRASGRSCGACG